MGAATLLAVCVMCGCGNSTVTADQVKQARDTLLSDARESALLAQTVAAGSALGSSTSSHAHVLSDDAQMAGATLSHGTLPTDQRDRAHRLLRDSGALVSLLDRLAQSSEPAGAAALQAQLQSLSDDIAGA